MSGVCVSELWPQGLLELVPRHVDRQLILRGGSAQTWDFTYRDDGELATVVFGGETTTHDYLSDGRLKKITLPTGATRELFYQDTNDSHAYVSGKNPWLRKVLDKKSDGTTKIVEFVYELDRAGRIVGVLDKDGKYLQVGWDPFSNAVGETSWSAKAAATRSRQYAWAYDPGRNRIRQFLDGVQRSYTIGDFGEVTVSGTDVLTYDHFCNLKTWTVGLNTTSFDWDFEGNLVKIDYPGTSNDDTHEYDGNGIRMRSKLSGASDWTNFVADEVTGNLVAEYTLVSGTFTLQQVNTWGAGLLWTRRGSTDRYFHCDGEGGTRALTDDSQATSDTYTYNRFGVLESSTGSSVNPFRWKGESGAYDDGARGSVQGWLLVFAASYVPALGRDAAGGKGAGQNVSPDQLRTTDRLTKEDCREACNGAFPKKSQEGVRRACYAICKRLRGDSCRALWNLCQHMSRHNEQGVKICLQLYNALCWGE